MPIRFSCQTGCTACCEETGYVYLTEADLRRAAAFLGFTPGAFERRYVYRTRRLLRLRKPRSAECHFLTARGCAIHPAKPTQCRTFPFWPEVSSCGKEWRRLKSYCPGIGQGEVVPEDAILRMNSDMREAYPAMYEATASGS